MARHSNDANFEGINPIGSVGNNHDEEEEKKMANTFGSIQALMDKQPNNAMMNYPLTEDELSARPV